MQKNSIASYFIAVTKLPPNAVAIMHGDSAHPDISGTVRFYQTRSGVLVSAELFGLPAPVGDCQNQIFGFHIHSGASCTRSGLDPFGNSGMHYNPKDCLHPYHAGDLPPLFGNQGYAFSMFLTDHFSVREIIGRTVIVHSLPDDFTTQPSGDSGNKIACGEITSTAK